MLRRIHRTLGWLITALFLTVLSVECSSAASVTSGPASLAPATTSSRREVPVAGSAQPLGASSVRPWSLVFDEGFDGSTLDTTKWTTCFWWARTGCTIKSNHELQWYQPEQVAVRDGELQLTARRKDITGDGRTYPFRSGLISSGRTGEASSDRPRFAFTYGFVEVRFRAPAQVGLWSAAWMLPVTNGSLPEIDLFEAYGGRTTRPSATLHYDGGQKHEYIQTDDLSVGWHTVGLEWSPGHLRWLFDGQERQSFSGRPVPAEPMYLLADLAVGGRAGAPTDLASYPGTFRIDSINVWQQR